MAGIFISYRRADSDVAAGRLADDLAEHFGRDAIFRDVDTLQAGEDYSAALDRALASCAVLLAIIGPGWSTSTDGRGRRRIDDPNDWVRVEIKRALERGIRVVPVLISTPIPNEEHVPEDLKPLLQRQAFELSDRHWRQGVELLTQVLERVPGVAPPAARRFAVVSRRRVAAAAGVVAVLLAAAFAWSRWSEDVPATAGPVDLSQWVRIRDSGPEGAVAGLAVVMAMEASLAQQKRPVTLSARYLYEKAKSLDRFGSQVEGTDITAALYVAETFGAPPEDRWPYIAGSRDLPTGMTWDAMDRAAVSFRARAFRLAEFTDIAEQLARGRPVLAEVVVTDAWMSEEAARTGVITIAEKERVLGGHAIVIVGFDPADSSVTFTNSWGVGWGVDGFGRMSAAAAKKALKAMWAIEVPLRES